RRVTRICRPSSLREYSCRISSMMAAGSIDPGELVSRTNPKVCWAKRATRPTSCSAWVRYSTACLESWRARYSRLMMASSGLLISCAMEAARRPAVASFSLRRHGEQHRAAGAVFAHALGSIGSYVFAAVEQFAVAFRFVLALGWRELSHRRAHGLLGGVAVEKFGGAIPTGDGAIGTGAVNRVTGIFDDGCHLAGGAIGARLRQGFLAGHASGKGGSGEENQQPFHVRSAVDAETEVRRELKKIHAGAGEKRAENRGAK